MGAVFLNSETSLSLVTVVACAAMVVISPRRLIIIATYFTIYFEFEAIVYYNPSLNLLNNNN